MFALATVALAMPRVRSAGRPSGLSSAAVVFTFLPARPLHADRRAVLVAEGTDRGLLPRAASPEERLIAYQLYWRGETFYTSNEIYEGPSEERTVFDQDGADDKLKDWLSRHRGRRDVFPVRAHQQARIKGLLPAEARGSFRVVDEQNNKFSLARAEI